MQSLEGCDVKKRIEKEVHWCFTFEKGHQCAGASGRKLRQVCVWCPNYKRKEGENNEKDH